MKKHQSTHPTGGTFTLHSHGSSSAPLPHDATPQVIRKAMTKLSPKRKR